MIQAQGSTQAARRQKHIAFDQAINVLGNATDRLQDLRNRINEAQPTDSKVQPGAPYSEPSLFQFLSDGEDRIQSQVQKIDRLVGEISELLF